MPFRTIKQWPSKFLSQPAEKASLEDIKSISIDLIDTLKVVAGAGLAAPQIGISKKILVIDTERFQSENPDKDIDGSNFWIVANPVLKNCAGEWKWKEACLSVPLVSCMVTRSETLTLEYDDLNGKRKSIEMTTPLSLALQHEADHLEGKTILDRVGKSASHLYKRKIRKSILKSLRKQKELEKELMSSGEPNIGRPKKKSHLSTQEVKKRKKNRRRNLMKK
tara:strand:- start:945 stop:1610 length:666 start_codon:yes stop_codon:yes gene_type:complete